MRYGFPLNHRATIKHACCYLVKWLFKVCHITSMKTQCNCLSKFVVLSAYNVHVHSKGNLVR